MEVQGTAAGKDGAPRFQVELLFGAGAGTALMVEAANLELDKDRVLDPAMQTLVAAMQALAPGAAPEEQRRDWAGLPIELLAKIAETHIAQTEAGWAAYYKGQGWPEKQVQERMAKRQHGGNCCLFVFARVCKEWRKAQLKVWGPLRTRVESDVLLPGSVALAKWALVEGCPRERGDGVTMPAAAAQFGHMELVRWLIQEQGFAMDEDVMGMAARGGNLELVRWLRGEGCDWSAQTCTSAASAGQLEALQWLRAEGCPWDHWMCYHAIDKGHVGVLRWARENGCPWDAATRDKAASELGYTDHLGNLVDWLGLPI